MQKFILTILKIFYQQKYTNIELFLIFFSNMTYRNKYYIYHKINKKFKIFVAFNSLKEKLIKKLNINVSNKIKKCFKNKNNICI